MPGSRNVIEQGAAPAAWDMSHAPATSTRRLSTVSSVGSHNPMRSWGHERRWWRRLMNHGLLLLLEGRLLLLLRGRLLLLHGRLLLLHCWQLLPHHRLLLLHGRLQMELHTWQRLLVSLSL